MESSKTSTYSNFYFMLNKNVAVKKRTQTNKQIITLQIIFLIQGLLAVDAEDIAETNCSQVGAEDLNSSASEILHIQRDIERSLQELVSIPIFILCLK